MPNDRATRGSRADRVNAVPDASIHRLAASFPGLFEAMGGRSVIRLLHTNWKCQLISSNTAITPGDAKFNQKYTITSHYPFPARLPEVPRTSPRSCPLTLMKLVLPPNVKELTPRVAVPWCPWWVAPKSSLPSEFDSSLLIVGWLAYSCSRFLCVNVFA